MSSTPENPYEAPQSIEELPKPFDTLHEAELLSEPEIKIRPLRSVFKWTVICGLSAAPSFFWGAALGSQLPQILGMLAGILVFIALYSMADCHPMVQRFLNRRHVRLTARIGYGTRVVISIILVGAYLDMIVGMVAISISSTIFSDISMGPGSEGNANAVIMFTSFMFTTIIQGILLNILLGCYMLVVYVICRLSGSR